MAGTAGSETNADRLIAADERAARPAAPNRRGRPGCGRGAWAFLAGSCTRAWCEVCSAPKEKFLKKNSV
jgi:hypothetical protein